MGQQVRIYVFLFSTVAEVITALSPNVTHVSDTAARAAIYCSSKSVMNHSAFETNGISKKNRQRSMCMIYLIAVC